MGEGDSGSQRKAIVMYELFPAAAAFSGDNVTTLLIALFGGAGASFVAGYFARPKNKAEAQAANANANVSLSADAREWAKVWMEKAEKAEEEAEKAQRKAEDAEERVDALEHAMTQCILYVHRLRTQILQTGQSVPPPPDPLRKWLGQHPD